MDQDSRRTEGWMSGLGLTVPWGLPIAAVRLLAERNTTVVNGLPTAQAFIDI